MRVVGGGELRNVESDGQVYMQLVVRGRAWALIVPGDVLRVISSLARGPNPRARLDPPLEGERCPRCHKRVAAGRSRPCLLCAPELVPAEFGGEPWHAVPDPQVRP